MFSMFEQTSYILRLEAIIHAGTCAVAFHRMTSFDFKSGFNWKKLLKISWRQKAISHLKMWQPSGFSEGTEITIVRWWKWTRLITEVYYYVKKLSRFYDFQTLSYGKCDYVLFINFSSHVNFSSKSKIMSKLEENPIISFPQTNSIEISNDHFKIFVLSEKA